MRILIIDEVHDILPITLKDLGHECDILIAKDYNFYLKVIPQYDGLILRSCIRIDKKIIDAGTNLKFIGRVGAGLENIDTEYAIQKGVLCINSPEGNRTAVAEHAVGMLLSLINNMNRADAEVRDALWQREANRGIELSGKTVGIIGYGNMGSAFAQRLCGFEVEVLAYDKYKNNYSDAFAKESTMEDLFHKSDIVSIHTPLTEETQFLINNKWINQFKKDIIIINTARGPILNTNDLVDSIKSRKVLGACLDVLEYEKLGFENIEKEDLPAAFNYLSQSQKVILSPHIAGWTHQSNFKLSKVISDKINMHFSDDSASK